MSQFVVLSSNNHSQLKVKKNASMAYAATQQALPIEAVEVAKAVINFPVFFTKNQHDEMTLSAIVGLNAGQSLFAKGEKWDASYIPSCLKTYPFYLMHSPEEENQMAIGIQEDNPSFSQTEGDALFDGEGKPTQRLEQASNLLNEHVENVKATIRMADGFRQLDIYKPIEILLQYQDNTVTRLNGLYTINEEKLGKLAPEELTILNQEGYLVVMHAMLISVSQINNLVRKHNESDAQDKIVNIKVEFPETAS